MTILSKLEKHFELLPSFLFSVITIIWLPYREWGATLGTTTYHAPHQATTDQLMEQQKYYISFQFCMGNKIFQKEHFWTCVHSVIFQPWLNMGLIDFVSPHTASIAMLCVLTGGRSEKVIIKTFIIVLKDHLVVCWYATMK